MYTHTNKLRYIYQNLLFEFKNNLSINQISIGDKCTSDPLSLGKKWCEIERADKVVEKTHFNIELFI